VRTSSSMRSASRSSRAVPEWIERKTDEPNVVTALFWTTRPVLAFRVRSSKRLLRREQEIGRQLAGIGDAG